MICTVYMHYNQLHIVENRYRLSVSALICYIISVIGISAKCCIGAPLSETSAMVIHSQDTSGKLLSSWIQGLKPM